jgi:hypothetical protein
MQNILWAIRIVFMFALFGVNVYATILAFNKKLNKPWYGGWQVAAVWVLPVVGAIITIYIQWKKRGMIRY